MKIYQGQIAFEIFLTTPLSVMIARRAVSLPEVRKRKWLAVTKEWQDGFPLAISVSNQQWDVPWKILITGKQICVQTFANQWYSL